jgi:hypothetical protein
LGIGSDTIDLLIKLRATGYLYPRNAVMEIGAQQLSQDFLAHQEKLAQLGLAFGIERRPPLSPPEPSRIAHGDLQHLAPDAPRARDFWLWLGFDYAAVDIDASPGSIPLDLNYDRVPPHARQKYDLVTNFGTTEHIANQLNAFEVIHDLTKPGGIMLHQLPVQGMLTHGLLNYNLKFFWSLARSNGYTFVHARWSQSRVSYSPPPDLVEFLSACDPATAIPDFKVADASVTVAIQKSFDIRFVPPIDVDAGTATGNKKLRKRYWTIFNSEAFGWLEASGGRAHTSPKWLDALHRPVGLLNARLLLALVSLLVYAFAFLGPNISLPISFYLLLIGAAAVIYIARFRDQRLLLIPATFAAFTAMLLTPLAAAPPVADHAPVGGVLYFNMAAIVPALYLILEFFDERRKVTFTPQQTSAGNDESGFRLSRRLVLIVLQVCLLLFAYFAGTGAGGFLAAVVVAALAALWLDRRHRASIREDLAKIGAAVVTAAAFVLVLIVAMPRDYWERGQILGALVENIGTPASALNTQISGANSQTNRDHPVTRATELGPHDPLLAVVWHKPKAIAAFLQNALDLRSAKTRSIALLCAAVQCMILLLFIVCGVLVFGKNFMVQWLVFVFLGVFCLPQILLDWSDVHVGANLVFFQFSTFVFLFAMPVEGLTRLYRPRIAEHMIVHRNRGRP